MIDKPSDAELIQKLSEMQARGNHIAPSRRSEILLRTKLTLSDEVRANGYVYVGPNAERRFDLNRVRFNSIIAMLQEDGYVAHYVELEKPGTETSEVVLIKVLAAAGTSHQEVWQNRDKILKLWQNAQPTDRS